MAEQRRLLGLDIGGTKCAALVGDESGHVQDRVQWSSKAERGPESMLADLIDHGRTLLDKYPDVSSVGVPIGGPMDAERGIVHRTPNLPGWEQVPLKQKLEDAFERPVKVEHDAIACAMAECQWGAGQGQSRAAYLTCGTGFGVGLVFDGKPYHGQNGRSVEIGHVRYRDEGPVAFGKQGCFEAYCAGSSLPRVAAWKYPKRWGQDPPDGKQLSELNKQGDVNARQVIEINARTVGDACALLGDLLFLDVIILGNLGRYLGHDWIELVRQQFQVQVLPESGQFCHIELAGLGERLQDCSALVVALRK